MAADHSNGDSPNNGASQSASEHHTAASTPAMHDDAHPYHDSVETAHDATGRQTATPDNPDTPEHSDKDICSISNAPEQSQLPSDFPPPNPDQRAGGWHPPIQQNGAVNSGQSPQYQQNPHYMNADFQQLRSAQTFVLIAGIIAPISLFFGGVLFDVAGFVLAYMGYRKIKAVIASTSEIAEIAKRMQKTAKIIMVVNAVIGVLNLVAAIIMMPMLMEAYSSGNFSSILNGSGSAGSGTTSTWG